MAQTTKTQAPDPERVIRPYEFYGVNLHRRAGSTQAVGDCPFCGRDGKFYLATNSDQWRCMVCNEGADTGRVYKGGNVFTFLRLLHDYSFKATTDRDRQALAMERGFLSVETVRDWRLAKSVLTGEWLLPGYSLEGRLDQLYKYTPIKDASTGSYKKRLLPGPGLWPDSKAQRLLGMHLFDPAKPSCRIAEGAWDGMALYETLRHTKKVTEKLPSGSSPDPKPNTRLEPCPAKSGSSLLDTVNVVAVPGATTFSEEWLPAFASKQVTILFHNDHPRPHKVTGRTAPPAGREGTRRVATLLLSSSAPPSSVAWLKWGSEGYDPALPSGYDMRDHLRKGSTHAERIPLLTELLHRVAPAPTEWMKDASSQETVATKTSKRIQVTDCDSWDDLTNSWRKAMAWGEGLDRALSVMLCSVMSIRVLGDLIWVKVISPPSTGKSTLCEAISVARQFVHPESVIRGFHSGMRPADGGDAKAGPGATSLLARLKDKCLVMKDGDTLLKSPNVEQILSEGRDIYDGAARSHYRTGYALEWDDYRMGWILCGTSAMRKIDQSELGQRFIDCVIMDKIDDDHEDEVLLRVVNRAEEALAYETNCKAGSQYTPEQLRAMQLTGGYVVWLCRNAGRLLRAQRPMTDADKLRCGKLAKFVSYLRARPSRDKDSETAEREFSTRLAVVLTRLAKCLAVVLNKQEVDGEVMRRVDQVAFDTSRGRTFDMVREMYVAGPNGILSTDLGHKVSEASDKVGALLRFLRQIDVVEVHNFLKGGYINEVRWRLLPRLRRLWEEVVVNKGRMGQ
jgi:hypothetical protein